MKSFTTNPAKDGLGIRFQKMVFRDNMVVYDKKNKIYWQRVNKQAVGDSDSQGKKISTDPGYYPQMNVRDSSPKINLHRRHYLHSGVFPISDQ
jgi:hypothetical protein